MPVRAIRRVKRRQIHPLDRIDHKPRQVILRQPVTKRRRQQKRLLTITIDEVLRHPRSQSDPPDRTRFVRLSEARPGCRGGFWIGPAASSQPATTEARFWRRGGTWPTVASVQLSSLCGTQPGRRRRSRSSDAGATAPAAISGCSRIGKRGRGPWSDPSAGWMGSARRVVLVQRRSV
jgi:hypothetical protein